MTDRGGRGIVLRRLDPPLSGHVFLMLVSWLWIRCRASLEGKGPLAFRGVGGVGLLLRLGMRSGLGSQEAVYKEQNALAAAS